MDMIGHDAVGQNAEPGGYRVGLELVEIKTVVSFVKEDLLTCVSPLGDVVGDASSTIRAIRDIAEELLDGKIPLRNCV